MIRSMTAFTRVAAPVREGGWGVEIRSLNHRYFEFSLKIPPVLNSLEGRIRDMVQAVMRRGKVTVSINQDSRDNKERGVALDESVLKLYLATVMRIKKKYKLQGDLSVSDLLRLPGIFSSEEPEADCEKSWAALKKVLARALDEAVKAKKIEGRKLARDISGRLEKIREAVEKVERHAAAEPGRIFKRLSERVDILLSEKEKDPDRMNREVAFLAERSDITEEIVRMKSHLELFRERLEQESEVGRELDFLCQEMNREVNTMASKAQLFEISTEAVFVKGELEKVREQIQNIE